MKKRRKKSRIVLGALCTLAVLVFSFFAITHVTDGNATVTGNVWVREDEIRKLVFDGGFWSRNSLYLCKVRKTVVPEKSALINSIDIEYAGINKVVLRVNENSPIGYVEVGDKDYYFDLKGVVLEVRKTDSPMVIVNEEEETTRQNVFAGGDAVTGAATVILAMGAGKKAAASIAKRLLKK
jgi:cell division septal protein FtsQ